MVHPSSVLSVLLALGQTAPAARTGLETVPLVRRIVVLGASLSHGYGLDAEVEARVGFADVVEATLLAEHEPVRSRTSLLFFTDPLETSRRLVDKAREDDPSLVCAIDYLFWFGYGLLPSDEARLEFLEKGLASLEGFTCPLVLGDLPDMSPAARSPPPGGLPPLLVPEQVPSASCLARLNRRIRDWAAGREGVVVLPLADLISRLQAEREIVIHGNRWAPGARGGFLGPDRLHPTLEGAVALWLAGLDAVAASRENLPAAAVDWSAESVRTRVYDAKATERRAGRERAERRPDKGDSTGRRGDGER